MYDIKVVYKGYKVLISLFTSEWLQAQYMQDVLHNMHNI